jgi:hypothetical protein
VEQVLLLIQFLLLAQIPPLLELLLLLEDLGIQRPQGFLEDQALAGHVLQLEAQVLPAELGLLVKEKMEEQVLVQVQVEVELEEVEALISLE